MAFSPRNIVGCLLKKRLTKGGVTGTPGPPLPTPLCTIDELVDEYYGIQVGVVLKRTIVGDSHLCFNNLSGSHQKNYLLVEMF